MRCVTWSKDSHGLFDYESRHISKKNIKSFQQGRIVRLDNDGPLEGKAFAGELDRIMTLALSVMQDAGAVSAMEAFMVVGAICNASGSGTSHLMRKKGRGGDGRSGGIRDSHTHVCTHVTLRYTCICTAVRDTLTSNAFLLFRSPHPPLLFRYRRVQSVLERLPPDPHQGPQQLRAVPGVRRRRRLRR